MKKKPLIWKPRQVIARLEKENRALKRALKPVLTKGAIKTLKRYEDFDGSLWLHFKITLGDLRRAARAYNKK